LALRKRPKASRTSEGVHGFTDLGFGDFGFRDARFAPFRSPPPGRALADLAGFFAGDRTESLLVRCMRVIFVMAGIY